ncbi:MAG: hypothetical protein H6728_03135 [Myxococcales bacterium]|nr:hypothetical protein [Myxococcales bacterium]
MKKLILSAIVVLSVAASQSACGVFIPTCESFLETYCQRISQCSSQDPNTQQQQLSQCMRRAAPETTCRYLTPQQKGEFESIVRNDCQTRMRESICTGNSIDTGPTCNQIINNFLGTLSN